MPNTQLHRCLVLTLAGLLLLLHTGLGQLLARQQVTAVPTTASKAAKPDKAGQTVVKATAHEAVVAPALSFDFSQVTYLLFTANIRLLTLNRPLLRRLFDSPPFYSSYLRQVFGHFIAPNAP